MPDTDIDDPSPDGSDNSVNPVPATTDITDDDDINLAEPETEDNIITDETVDNEIAPPRRSKRVHNPMKIYEPSFTGKKYATAATTIGHSFATVPPITSFPPSWRVGSWSRA